MDCAVENAMIKHQEKLVNQETSLQLFLDDIDDDLAEIMDIVKVLKRKARDYDGYDFSEDLKEVLEELIWKF